MLAWLLKQKPFRTALLSRVRYGLLFTSLIVLADIRSPRAEEPLVFAEQSVSKKSIYEGEQTIYEFSLNTRTQLFDFQPPELTLAHAWTETIAVNQRLRKLIGEEVWSSYTTRRAVYPLATGTFEFPELSVAVGLRVRAKRKAISPFGFEDAFSDQIIEQFFAEYTRKEVSLRASKVIMDVNPLPARPTGFAKQQSYLPVGSSHVSAQLSAQEITLGETTTLQVTVISTGSLNPLKQVEIEFPSEIKSYAEGTREEKNENNGALITRKVFRISLVPRSAGAYTIPAIQFAYFDPDSKTYEIAQSAPFSLTVHPNSAVQKDELVIPNSEILSSSPSSSTPLPSDTPSTEPLWAKVNERLSVESQLFIATGLIVSLALAALIIFLFRRSAPLRRAKAVIHAAQDFDQLARAVRLILQQKFNLPIRDYSLEEWCALISLQGLPNELQFNALSLIDQIENRRVSLKEREQCLAAAQKDETLQVISAILGF